MESAGDLGAVISLTSIQIRAYMTMFRLSGKWLLPGLWGAGWR